MGEQDVTAQPPPPRHTAYTAQPPGRELLGVGRPLSRQAEAYLDDVLPRLEKDEYEIVFGEQGFDCVAKRSRFELAKFGFADYTIVFVEFGRLDARSLWEFSRAAFGYAAARGGMAQPGLQGGRFCFPVALISADEGAIRAVRDGAAPMHFAAFEFPCVYDLRADELHYRQRTPLFGGAYYAGMRSLAARLLSRRPCQDAIPGGATAEAVTAFSRPLVQKGNACREDRR